VAGDREAVRLRALAAELRAEAGRISRTVDDLGAAAETLSSSAATDRLALYGTAALLETFYTGVERALVRVAGSTGEAPEGPAWHRRLLEIMSIEIPEVRPQVLSPRSASELEEYLAFRHRFRNLYLFDLQPVPVLALAARAHEVWTKVHADLERFADTLELIAQALEA
jgi:HepT-like protein